MKTFKDLEFKAQLRFSRYKTTVIVYPIENTGMFNVLFLFDEKPSPLFFVYTPCWASWYKVNREYTEDEVNRLLIRAQEERFDWWRRYKKYYKPQWKCAPKKFINRIRRKLNIAYVKYIRVHLRRHASLA